MQRLVVRRPVQSRKLARGNVRVSRHEPPQHMGIRGRDPAHISLINVGDFARSSASQPSKRALPPERLEVDAVLDPADLTTLGIRISEQLSEWGSTDEQPVVCFHSLTELLEATDLNRAFRFLHLLTRRLSLAGAIAHFHLDPETCDEKTIETLRPLFVIRCRSRS